jgi:hypothetical protein
MIAIEYPPYEPKIKLLQQKKNIFDAVRKKWVALTPEEWVRQNFLQYLLQVKNYPTALIAVEKEIALGEIKKRFDIVVFDATAKPFMLVECKAMQVPLSADVLEQALRYTITVPVPYIVITNGTHCMAYKKDADMLLPIIEIPSL